MARDLLEGDAASADFLRQAEDRLAMPLGRLMAEGPEAELQATRNAQPAILFHSLALLRLLASRGFGPALVAGHSMGEFAGLVAADALAVCGAAIQPCCSLASRISNEAASSGA